MNEWMQPPSHAGSLLADFSPEDGGNTILRNVGSHNLHCARSQKMTFFIVTAVETSNLTIHDLLQLPSQLPLYKVLSVIFDPITNMKTLGVEIT
jgi:hypothetical protein